MQDAHPSTPNDSAPATEAPKKNRSGLYIFISILFAALLGAGIYLLKASQSAEEEEIAYEILENNVDPKDYERFLETYPRSEHASEVKSRLEKLQAMLSQWDRIALSDRPSDFLNFKNNYNHAAFNRRCDIKIDSLDFILAQKEGTPEAFTRYLTLHPDGLYASEASIAQGNLRDTEVTPEDRDRIMTVINDFYEGFEDRDEEAICSNIAATMKTFLSRKDATKATVVRTIKEMFNEHILDCSFTVNRDITITRQPGTDGSYIAELTVDQHIERDNEGKTFGSYKVVAEINRNLLITSLTMEEISRQ